MLKKFTIQNYKNFKNKLVLDLNKVAGYRFNLDCIYKDTITKSIIYGRNATGKTNLGKALGDISYTLIGGGRILDLSKEKSANADSIDKTVKYKYEFSFDNEEIVYEYQKNQNDDLEYEILYVNNEQVYKLNFITEMFECINLEKINAETVRVDKFINLIKQKNEKLEVEEETEQIPFLRYLLTNGSIATKSPLYQLEDYVRGMRYYSVAQQIPFLRRSRFASNFADYLGKENNLTHFEEFLNIMGIECKLKTYKSVDGNFELFFMHNTPIHFFENASSGTLALTNFYMRYIATNKNPSFIYMDEFDAFYHYEMAERLVKYFKKKYPYTQVIMTTHNTNLMSNNLMRPDCLFILSREGKITALCDATARELREGHNLEKLYIGGEFEQYE